MKRLIIFICCSFCVPTPAIAGLSNIRNMNRNSNDGFDVTCLNGALEIVNAEAILDNLVCKTATDKSYSAGKSVVCTGSTPWSYITRISDGKTIGDSFPIDQCEEAVRTSSKSVVCTGSTPWSYITRISDGKTIGDSFPLDQCLRAVRDSSKSVVCTGSTAWFYITRISDGKRLGDSSSLYTCLQLSRGKEK
jgi:hypothetical protein